MLRPGMRTDRLAAPRLHPTPRLFGDSPRDVTGGITGEEALLSVGVLLINRPLSLERAAVRAVCAQIIILDYGELIWAVDRIGGSGRESN